MQSSTVTSYNSRNICREKKEVAEILPHMLEIEREFCYVILSNTEPLSFKSSKSGHLKKN